MMQKTLILSPYTIGDNNAIGLTLEKFFREYPKIEYFNCIRVLMLMRKIMVMQLGMTYHWDYEISGGIKGAK